MLFINARYASKREQDCVAQHPVGVMVFKITKHTHAHRSAVIAAEMRSQLHYH